MYDQIEIFMQSIPGNSKLFFAGIMFFVLLFGVWINIKGNKEIEMKRKFNWKAECIVAFFIVALFVWTLLEIVPKG